MGRSPCCSKEEMKRGAWTAMEDQILRDYIKEHGEGKWRNIPKSSGLKRCGKSCRLRWLNYLRPNIKRGNITPEEEDLILRLHKLLGNRWSLIAGRLPGRTDNEIKNYWNTTLSKKVKGEESKVGTKKSKTRQPIKTLPPDKAHFSPIVRTGSTRYEAPFHAQPKKSECSTDEKPAEQQPSLDPESGNRVAMESKSRDESPLALSEEDGFNTLPMDFSLSELLLVDDIAETEFWKLCQFEKGAEEGVDRWMEESQKNWMPTDDSFNYRT